MSSIRRRKNLLKYFFQLWENVHEWISEQRSLFPNFFLQQESFSFPFKYQLDILETWIVNQEGWFYIFTKFVKKISIILKFGIDSFDLNGDSFFVLPPRMWIKQKKIRQESPFIEPISYGWAWDSWLVRNHILKSGAINKEVTIYSYWHRDQGIHPHKEYKQNKAQELKEYYFFKDILKHQLMRSYLKYFSLLIFIIISWCGETISEMNSCDETHKKNSVELQICTKN